MELLKNSDQYKALCNDRRFGQRLILLKEIGIEGVWPLGSSVQAVTPNPDPPNTSYSTLNWQLAQNTCISTPDHYNHSALGHYLYLMTSTTGIQGAFKLISSTADDTPDIRIGITCVVPGLAGPPLLPSTIHLQMAPFMSQINLISFGQITPLTNFDGSSLYITIRVVPNFDVFFGINQTHNVPATIYGGKMTNSLDLAFLMQYLDTTTQIFNQAYP